jgi:hypothetical protein
MATIREEQRMKFLMKARAKKAQPEDKVDALSQLEVVEGDKKKKRKVETGRIRMEVPNKGSGSAVAAVEVGGETGVKSPPKKKRSLIRKEKDDKEVGLHETTAPVAETSPVVEARTGAISPGIHSSTQSSFWRKWLTWRGTPLGSNPNYLFLGPSPVQIEKRNYELVYKIILH